MLESLKPRCIWHTSTRNSIRDKWQCCMNLALRRAPITQTLFERIDAAAAAIPTAKRPVTLLTSLRAHVLDPAKGAGVPGLSASVKSRVWRSGLIQHGITALLQLASSRSPSWSDAADLADFISGFTVGAPPTVAQTISQPSAVASGWMGLVALAPEYPGVRARLITTLTVLCDKVPVVARQVAKHPLIVSLLRDSRRPQDSVAMLELIQGLSRPRQGGSRAALAQSEELTAVMVGKLSMVTGNPSIEGEVINSDWKDGEVGCHVLGACLWATWALAAPPGGEVMLKALRRGSSTLKKLRALRSPSSTASLPAYLPLIPSRSDPTSISKTASALAFLVAADVGSLGRKMLPLDSSKARFSADSAFAASVIAAAWRGAVLRKKMARMIRFQAIVRGALTRSRLMSEASSAAKASRAAAAVRAARAARMRSASRAAEALALSPSRKRGPRAAFEEVLAVCVIQRAFRAWRAKRILAELKSDERKAAAARVIQRAAALRLRAGETKAPPVTRVRPKTPLTASVLQAAKRSEAAAARARLAALPGADGTRGPPLDAVKRHLVTRRLERESLGLKENQPAPVNDATAALEMWEGEGRARARAAARSRAKLALALETGLDTLESRGLGSGDIRDLVYEHSSEPEVPGSRGKLNPAISDKIRSAHVGALRESKLHWYRSLPEF